MLKYRSAWLAGGWSLVAAIFYLSLTPHPLEPLSFQNVDKLEHAIAYGSLGLWFFQLYPSFRSRVIAVSLLIGMGIGIEYLQRWTGYRQFDVWDMVSNSIGVLSGLLLVRTGLGRSFLFVETVIQRVL